MWVIFLIVVVLIYVVLDRKLNALNNKVSKLNEELRQVSEQINSSNLNNLNDLNNSNNVSNLDNLKHPASEENLSEYPSLKTTQASPSSYHPDQNQNRTESNLNSAQTDRQSIYLNDTPVGAGTEPTETIYQSHNLSQSVSKEEATTPDEQSLPVVTSLLRSFKNWFFGGNLVVRVGAIVLLMGVVLLLRLLSEYFDTPIEVKLLAIGIIGLVVAGLGLKLVKKRFSYGITLQGAGLSAAYLTTYFAYQVYHVIPNVPSFVLLGVLSTVTVALAIRQNAFPLALLAFSGAFLAPILTSSDTDSLTVLFSYYLLLNTAIAIIAHYRTWKVLNLLGAAVTFGLAYYWGFTDAIYNDFATFTAQRWSLVLIISLHWVLYVFIAIRYAQQIIAYNRTLSDIESIDAIQSVKQAILFPIDTGLMFATPLLVFGLLATLLQDIEHGLTVVSAVMSATYLGVGWILAQRSRRYALLTEGMLALGFGFLALIIPLEFDAQWVAFGWSVQGLALVWFGRRSLRAWSVLFGVLLQALAILSLLDSMGFDLTSVQASYLALSVSALCWMASMFVLRHAYSPLRSDSVRDKNLLSCVNTNSTVFKLIWQSPTFIYLLTLIGVFWTLLVTALNLDNWFNLSYLDVSLFIAAALLINLIVYYLIDRYRTWSEVSLFNHGLLSLFYVALLLIIPEHYESYYANESFNWLIYGLLILGGLAVGQLWIKSWVEDYQVVYLNRENGENERPDNSSNTGLKISLLLDSIQPTFWLATGVILIAQFAHYLLPDSGRVLGILAPSLCLIGLTYWVAQNKLVLPLWFNWESALLGSAYLFVPIAIIWVVLSNLTHDGIIWGLPYIPLLNLYDVSVLLGLLYLLSTHRLRRNLAQSSKNTVLLKTIGLLGFWVLSSIMVRTLHTYADTPLWSEGAWDSDKVQTSLTILWTLTALIATFMSSRNGKRFWWFMGISLLGAVVLKLVLVDLSQTDAIWRVVSFLGAGSLILLIGYLAPLPPEEETAKPFD